MEHINGNGNGRLGGGIPMYGSGRLAPANSDRLPPSNLEAERSLLGSILLDQEVMARVVNLVSINDFYRDAHQVIYQGMLDLNERGAEIDAVTLGDELRGMRQFEGEDLDQIMTEIVEAVPHSANWKYYAGIIREKAIGRQLIEVGTEIVRDGYSNQYTADEQLGMAVKKLAGVEQRGAVDGPDDDLSIHPLPQKMDAAAYHGLAGRIVRSIKPQTEACAEAILLQFLVIFAMAMGSRPHWRVGGSVHRSNIFACLVGPTGIARKGTGFDACDWMLERIYPNWGDAVLRGLSSGEGLIKAVNDHRAPLLCLETEFGGTLGNMARENNNLASAFKQAWDGRRLSVTTKNNPMSCADAYVSVIGHITYPELKMKLKENDVENGLVNRFLWAHVYRDGKLPEGGDFESVKQALAPLLVELEFALEFARHDTGLDVPYRRDVEARKLWEPLYDQLTASRPGGLGSATVRAAPIVMRIAVIYAVLDREFWVKPDHLRAAMAVWNYCDCTAAHIFGSPRLEGDLGKLIAFIENAKDGLTRTEINRKLFRAKLKPNQLDHLLGQAQASGQIVYRLVKTGGSTRHEWVHAKRSKQ